MELKLREEVARQCEVNVGRRHRQFSDCWRLNLEQDPGLRISGDGVDNLYFSHIFLKEFYVCKGLNNTAGRFKRFIYSPTSPTTTSQKNEEAWLWVPEDNNELSSWGPVWGQSRTGPWLDPVQNLSQWLMIQPSPAWLRFVYRPHDRAIHSDNHNLTLWDQILVQDLWVPKTTWLCSGGDGAGVGSFSLQSLGSLPSFGLWDRPRGQEQGQQTK